MAEWTPLSLITATLTIATSCWIFLFIYNVLICSMPRSLWKKMAKQSGILLLVLTPATLIALYGNHPQVAPYLQLKQWHPAQAIIAAIALFAITNQAIVTLRLLKPTNLPQQRRHTEERHPYHPKNTDWNIYRDPHYPPQPKAGEKPAHLGPDAPPLPQYRHKIHKLKGQPWRTKIIRSFPLRKIDQTYDLRIHKYELLFPNLPKAFHGLKVLQMTDNHYCDVASPAWFEYVTDKANLLQPDLICLTGDLLGDDNLYREGIDALRPLTAPLGVWAVRGNHDFYSEPEIIDYWLQAAGIHTLTNERITLTKDRQAIWLIGIESPYAPVKDWTKLLGSPKTDTFRLAMTHQPDNAPRLAAHGIDLALAGHTHGGQWRLPYIGPLIYPSKHGRRYDRGLTRTGPKTLLYSSTGIGVHTIPFRFNCPPELTLFTLHSQR